MGYLSGCVKDYRCNAIKLPIDGHNIAPYVKLFFGDPSNPEITVGNNSSPKFDNTAIIKTFEFGSSNGIGFKAEILDHQGGNFHLFVEKLNKCMARSASDYKMAAQWGWIVTDCNGSKRLISSPKIVTNPISLDSTFADGKIKFFIEGNDTFQHVFVARHDEIDGSDDARKTLKSAIRNLGINTDPKFNVKFVRINKDGTESEYGFREGGFEGPKDVWDCDGQNKLATIQKWLEPFVTDRNKGIVPIFDSEANGFPTLILLEDPTLDCNESASPCALQSAGTYIVNGGKHSAVISFTPQFNWVAPMAALGAGGNSGAAATGETEKKEKACKVQTPETGILQSIPITRYAWNVHGPSNATAETEFAQNKHDKANAVFGASLSTITAELRIQGDPSSYFVHPKLAIQYPMSIVVINPFHLFGNGNNGCGDWLAQPGCNEILSNRNWRITGCNHTIKEGSYVTTLQVMLVAPGISVPGTEPFGGVGSNGYVPNNAC